MLRPIDMSITVQHAADAQRATSEGQGARPEIAHQQFADRLEKQARLQEQQVIKSNQSEKNDVNPDRQGFGGGYQPRRKTKKQQEKEKASKSQSNRVTESLYDIKI